MKNKKLLFLLITVLIIIISCIIIIINTFNKKNEESSTNIVSDYTPEEEISTSQLRKTLVTLYFLDSSSNQLKCEGKLIDSATLLKNPYKEITSLLLLTPQTRNIY